MSGIVGFVTAGLQVQPEVLGRLTDALAFRGPDGGGTLVCGSGRVGFGYSVLRTTDAADETPLFALDACWILADARIDARDELARELRAAGTDVAIDASAAEVILRAYAVWGESCVDHLIGDFAFAIWDDRQARLFCARDHLGVKPFFHAAVPGGIVFGNTLEALRLHPSVSSDLDDLFIADFLLFGGTADADATAFAAVRRLPAAHTLAWTGGAAHVRRYWEQPAREPLMLRRREEYVERFRDLLDAAVRDRTRSSRVGIALSGGLDSTAVAATARRVARATGVPTDLRAWTFVADDTARDAEQPFAAIAAKALGLAHHCVTVRAAGGSCSSRLALTVRPEPTVMAAGPQGIERMHEAAEYARVILTGQGGDVILRPSATYLARALSDFRVFRLSADIAHYFAIHRRPPRLGIRTRLAGNREARKAQLPAWIATELAERLDLEGRVEAMRRRRSLSDTHRPEAYRALRLPAWPALFGRYDPGATRLHFEIRHPLFDVRLVDYCLSLPSLPWCANKALLRRAMRNELPSVIVQRPKTPFGRARTTPGLADRLAGPLEPIEWSPKLARYTRAEALDRTHTANLNISPPAYARLLSLNRWLATMDHTNFS